ncbi:hypothetical protein Ahy_A06g026895 isoform A [Arachis hypogaea]|uniref:Uncharacterized protein n=1 Tax=Arachis hypogaea TaxID=3818 RepID=A0A445CM14_ARAHY|nr:hypothetical protein Ahy_A06g026895 isoform A [Arachis hypogaea]
MFNHSQQREPISDIQSFPAARTSEPSPSQQRLPAPPSTSVLFPLMELSRRALRNRLQFENNCEIGVFSKLTNAYCLVAIGGSENLYSMVMLA